MAATTSHHQPRSKSLPTRPHPLILQCNQHLANLEASDATSSSPSSKLFRHKLTDLQTLHDCVEKLVLLPLTEEAIVRERQEKWVDELLDGSLKLLDLCTVAKDSLLHTKECAREVQSIIRRKRGGETEVAAEVRKFLASRKVVKKAILKALGNLKGASKKGRFSPGNKDQQTASLASLLKDVEVITLSILESLLNFISGPCKMKNSKFKLQLISKSKTAFAFSFPCLYVALGFLFWFLTRTLLLNAILFENLRSHRGMVLPTPIKSNVYLPLQLTMY